MIGFTTLLIGGFSRFGVWREIVIAFGLLLVLDGVRGTLTSQVASTGSDNDGAYHFVTAVRENSELVIYIDGARDSAAPDTVSAATVNSAALQFGAGAGASPLLFDGLVDDVRFYRYQSAELSVRHAGSAIFARAANIYVFNSRYYNAFFFGRKPDGNH